MQKPTQPQAKPLVQPASTGSQAQKPLTGAAATGPGQPSPAQNMGAKATSPAKNLPAPATNAQSSLEKKPVTAQNKNSPTQSTPATSVQTSSIKEENKTGAKTGSATMADPKASAGATQPAQAAKSKDAVTGKDATKPGTPALTPEETQKLEDIRKKIAEKKETRRKEEDALNDMERLVSMKDQLEESLKDGEASIRRQDQENTQMEKQLIQMEIEVKREELIKELNAMKQAKKSDAIIATEMKNQEKKVAGLISEASQEESKLELQSVELRKQIERTIPEQINTCEKDIQMMKAQKTRLDKDLAKVKDQIGQVNVQDVQLMGNGYNKLASQVIPNSKTNIEEKDINAYDTIVTQISKRLAEQWRLIPHESMPEESPEQPVHLNVTPAKQPSPFPVVVKPATTTKVTPSPAASLMFLDNLLGSNLVKDVKAKAKEAALSITKDKNEFLNSEEQRKSFLMEQKLLSMKKIMSYESAIENFPDVQAELLTEINAAKVANSLLQETLAGLIHDKRELNEVKAAAAERQGTLEDEDQEVILEEAEEDQEGVEEDFAGEEQEEEYTEMQEEGEEEPDFEEDEVVEIYEVEELVTEEEELTEQHSAFVETEDIVYEEEAEQ